MVTLAPLPIKKITPPRDSEAEWMAIELPDKVDLCIHPHPLYKLESLPE
jgi:hypothetical protein